MKRILSFLFCLSTLCHASPYGLKDLKSLADISEYREFFEHAKDVPPAQRNQEWETLVTETFTKYISFLEQFAPLAERHFNKLLELNSWKVLRANESRLAQMNKLLKQYLESRIQTDLSSETMETVKVFWGQNFGDPTIGYSLGKLILEKEPGNLMGLQMLSTGFRSSISEVYCSDPEIYPHLIKGVEKIYKQLRNTEEFDVKLSGFMNRKCWQSLRPTLTKKLEDNATPNTSKKLLLNILTSDYATEQEVKSYAQFLFLLDGPEKSETLNKTWDILNDLKQKPELREKIANRIEKLDSIPDGTFKDLKEDQRYFLAKNLLINFPEFSDVYAKRCLGFLKGNVGKNPTSHCQNFYRVLREIDYKTISPVAFEALSPYFKDLKSIR